MVSKGSGRQWRLVSLFQILVVALAFAAGSPVAVAGAQIATSDTVSTAPDLAVPDFDEGTVWAVEPWPTRSANTAVVSGVGIGGIVRISLTRHKVMWSVPGNAKALLRIHRRLYVGTPTGVSRYTPPSLTPDWSIDLGGQVSTLEPHPQVGKIVAGGDFPGAVTVLNTDGTRDSAYGIPEIKGRGYPNSGPTGIYRADMQPWGNRYIAIGEFTTVGGLSRSQAVMLEFGPTEATVSSWDMPTLHELCAQETPQYLRDAEWDHSGTRIAFTATGKGGGFPDGEMCDSASTVSGLGESGDMVPTITKFCGDTGHSVEWTPDDTGLFVSGHFKCVAATPGLRNFQSRFGIALLDMPTQTLDAWRSDKCRGVGARELAWSSGLLVGYDCGFWGNNEAINPDPTPRISLGRFAFLPQVE